MDRRRLLLILAVFVAIIGTALVFLYVQGADKRAANKYSNADAYVATTNIPAGTNFDKALSDGQIVLHAVPQNILDENAGYQTDPTALKGQLAISPIFQGQVIVTAQWGDTITAATSNLPIPPGDIAISVNLTDPDRVAGNIQNGSDVAIFVTGSLQAAGATGATGSAGAESTRLLLPKVTVLNVGSPVATTSTTTDQNGTQTTEQLPRTLLTIAVTQKEAQKVILASKALDLTFGLLTPKSNVKPAPGTSTLVNSLFHK